MVFDINKILGSKKPKSSPSFSNMTFSNTFGKNKFSDMIGGLTSKPLSKMGAPQSMQSKWKGMTHQQRNTARRKHKDSDGDRVPDMFDCSPFNIMRQDFTPFRDQTKAEDMSAARRFGGRNLKGLNKLGSGRDRDVYELDKDKVLKVAKNPGGLSQNTSESEVEMWDLGKHYETGKDYVVMQRNQPLSKHSKQKLAMVRKEAGKAPHGRSRQEYLSNVKMRLSSEDNVLDSAGIGTDVLNYDFTPDELFANRQWGEDAEGNLQLNDGGALQPGDSLSKYRVKDFKSDDWQSQDWREVQQQRREYRDRGTFDEQRKQRRGYPQASYQEVADFFESDDQLQDDDNVTLYHGTRKDFLDSIKNKGLVRKSGGMNDGAKVYLTGSREVAMHHARQGPESEAYSQPYQNINLFDTIQNKDSQEYDKPEGAVLEVQVPRRDLSAEQLQQLETEPDSVYEIPYSKDIPAEQINVWDPQGEK